MRKLTTYWFSLQRSLTDPEYYFVLPRTRLFFSIQFFIFSLFLIALCEIPNWAYRLLPTVVADVRTEVTQLVAQVPEDAVFSFDGKQLTTHGVILPLTLTASQKAQDIGLPKNLITISSDESVSDAALTLSPTHVVYAMADSQGSKTTYTELFGEETGSLSRDQLRTGAYELLTLVKTYRIQLALLFALGGFFSSIFSGVFTILLYAVLIQVIGWLLGLRLTYRTAARWGLHIFPIALAIQELSSLLAPSGSFPILTVTYIAIATLVIWVGRTDRPTIIFK